MVSPQKARRPDSEALAIQDLRRIPGVGPAIARGLLTLGIRTVDDLRGRDPQALYDESNRMAGIRQDRCLLYVFRCAVYYASQVRHDPEKLKWWNWKDVAAKPTAARAHPGGATLLRGLANIGPTIAERLAEVGVCTVGDLRGLGPAEAFRRVTANNPARTIPVCYYLYALEGALQGIHWNDIPLETKRRLLREAGLAESRAGRS